MTNRPWSSAAFSGLLAVLGLGLLATAAGAAVPQPPLDQAGVRRLLLEEAEHSQVPPELALALARVESGFFINALSAKGAVGVLQIMPDTARGEYGIAPDRLWEPRLNIRLGLDFLGRLYQRYGGRWDLALAHYHSGTIEPVNGTYRVPEISRGYVDTVLRWRDRYAAQRALWATLDRRAAEVLDASAPPHPPSSERDPDFRDIEAKLAWARAVLDDFGPRPKRR